MDQLIGLHNQVEDTRIDLTGPEPLFRLTYTKRQVEVMVRYGNLDGTYKERFENVEFVDGYNVYQGLISHLKECIETTESE